MEVVRHDPLVHQGRVVPDSEHGLGDFPRTGAFLLHGLVEDVQQGTFTEDLLGHSGGRIEGRHDGLLGVLAGDLGTFTATVQHRLVQAGISVLTMAGVDHVAQGSSLAVASQDSQKLQTRRRGIKADGIARGLTLADFLPCGDACEEQGRLLGLLNQRVETAFILIDPSEANLPVLFFEDEVVGDVDFEIFTSRESLKSHLEAPFHIKSWGCILC